MSITYTVHKVLKGCYQHRLACESEKKLAILVAIMYRVYPSRARSQSEIRDRFLCLGVKSGYISRREINSN